MSPPLASVIVPAFNEGPQLADHLASLAHYLAQEPGPYDYEIIVVDDGSTDETYAAAAASSDSFDIPTRVIRHARNRGLGCAIRTGFAFADGTIAVIFDSDLSYSPEIIPQMLAQADRNDDDLVLASPYMRGGAVSNVPFLRRFLSREANRFLSFATNGRYATLTCARAIWRVRSSIAAWPELLKRALRS